MVIFISLDKPNLYSISRYMIFGTNLFQIYIYIYTVGHNGGIFIFTPV